MDRSEILNAADQAVTVDRAATHGEAERNFPAIVAMWDALDDARGNRPREASDVGLYMAAFKLVRASNNPGHIDSIVDACGYCAIAGELAAGEGGQ